MRQKWEYFKAQTWAVEALDFWCNKVLLLLGRKPCSPSISAASTFVRKCLLSALNRFECRPGVMSWGHIAVIFKKIYQILNHIWNLPKTDLKGWGLMCSVCHMRRKQSESICAWFVNLLWRQPWSAAALKRPCPETPDVTISWCFLLTRFLRLRQSCIIFLLMAVPPHATSLNRPTVIGTAALSQPPSVEYMNAIVDGGVWPQLLLPLIEHAALLLQQTHLPFKHGCTCVYAK